MRKAVALLFAAFLCLSSFAQTANYAISGKVIDAVTKQPLELASVFAQNTTIGTITAVDGSFMLSLPAGGYTLVITFVDYQTVTKRISMAEVQGKNISIELSRNENLLQDIIVASSNEVKDGWAKYGTFFLDNFIGKTKNSSSCKLVNKEVLKFYFSKKRNSLKVMAEAPLEILNEAFGYTIKYTLDSFTFDYNTMVTAYQGYPLFIDMQATDSVTTNNWATARLNSYKGSMLHFMRSLYNKQLKEEGFEIKFLIKEGHKEKAIPLLNYYNAMNYAKNDSTLTATILPVQTEVAVLYRNAKPEWSFVAEAITTTAKYQESALSFTPDEPVMVAVNGYYFDPASITKSGYLSWKRLADMLPYDFKPQ